jgi:hypothetical protein
MENVIAVLEGLHQQVYSDIATLGRAGQNVGELQTRANALAAMTVALNARVATDTDETADIWFAEAQGINDEFMGMLSETTVRRQDVTEGQQLAGLGWGVGVVVAAGAAWLLVKRGKRRR